MSKLQRPPTFEFYDEVERLGACGLSLEEVRDFFGASDETWVEFCEEYDYVEIKHREGRAKAVAIAGNELMHQVKAGKLQAIIFYLKTKGTFHEKSIYEIDSKNKIKMLTDLSQVDETEASKIYAEFMKQN
jgi:hypothetical protein